MKKIIPASIKAVKKFIRKCLGKKHYSDYIEETLQAWWGGANEGLCKISLSDCIENIPKPGDKNIKWNCCPHWHRKLTNKLTAREFVINHGIPVPELYWYGKNADEIPFDKLPRSYVIKTTFGAAAKQVIPVIDGVNAFTKEKYTPEMIREFFKESMEKVYPYGYIMIEELLTNTSGESLAKDYKAYVFNGVVHLIVVVNRLTGETGHYTREWERISEKIHYKHKKRVYETRPKHYRELIEYAERLGRGIGPHHSRIDFYITGKGCVFGEFTATPATGYGYTPYANRLLGELWKNMQENQDDLFSPSPEIGTTSLTK